MTEDGRLKSIELFAWVGEDENGSGEIGIKQGLVPAGFIPLVAIERSKIQRGNIVQGLTVQAQIYGKTIRLCRFVFSEVIQELEPKVSQSPDATCSEGGCHIPVIVHRTGGPSADLKNTCGKCGRMIQRENGVWVIEREAQS